MTPCEELGYKVGDKFYATENSVFTNTSYRYGEVVCLKLDDGSSTPYFRSEERERTYCITLHRLKKISEDVEGWIKWEGGECPVPKGTLVDVKFRNGEIKNQLPAMIEFGGFANDDASCDYWKNDDLDNDIIAYRLSDTGRADSATKEIKTTNNADGFAIVNLISSVCPELKVEDALEIASTLIDAGLKR